MSANQLSSKPLYFRRAKLQKTLVMSHPEPDVAARNVDTRFARPRAGDVNAAKLGSTRKSA